MLLFGFMSSLKQMRLISSSSKKNEKYEINAKIIVFLAVISIISVILAVFVWVYSNLSCELLNIKI